MQVLRYCFFIYNRLGRKSFDYLRKYIKLPSLSNMKRFKKRHVGVGSGYNPKMFEKAADLFSNHDLLEEEKDWHVILSWDATGYAKRIVFDKHTGALVGLDVDVESFNMNLEATNKVNCFMITSPDKRINFRYFRCLSTPQHDIDICLMFQNI